MWSSIFGRAVYLHYLFVWQPVIIGNIVRDFLARDSIYAIARYMPSPVCLAVRLAVRPSHGWISQRRLKLGLRNLHHRVAP